MLHTVSFLVSLAVVVTLHVLLGEMVPKNIAIAGPESTAMLLVPIYLVYVRMARPLIGLYNWAANTTLRMFGVQAKDELDVTVSTVELAEMIAESRSEGLLDPEEHMRLSRALQIRQRVAGDVAVPLSSIRTVPVAAAGSGPSVAAIEEVFAKTGYSRFPVVDAYHVGQFLMVWEVATALAGDFLRIDAFDQPGVEAAKNATYALMGRQGYEAEAARIRAELAKPPLLGC